MEDSITNIIVFGVISWTILFLLTRKMFPKRSFEFSGNLVSIIQSVKFILLASYTVQDWTSPLSPLTTAASPLQIKIMAADVAFFIYDLGRYQFDTKKVPIDYMIHHIFALAALIVGLAYQRWGSEAMAEIWIGEFSAPLFYVRDMLKELGYRGTNLYLAVDIMYIAAFTFAKMMCGIYLVCLILPAANYPLISKAAVLAIQLLNTFWFYNLVRRSMYKYFFKQRRNSSQKMN